VVALNGLSVSLDTATISGTSLTAQLSVYNGSPKEVSISSMGSFEVKDGDGNKAKYKLNVSGPPQLDGTVYPKDTLVGQITYDLTAPDPKELKLYYSVSLFGGDTLVFALK
jgi:hypothetical protein